jgi:predicted Zn-dependent protease
MELARQGRTADAREQFSEVVRLRPDFADAHLNLGVALAKERRFDEAIEQFRETLRRDPAHTNAQRFLNQALAAQPGRDFQPQRRGIFLDSEPQKTKAP